MPTNDSDDNTKPPDLPAIDRALARDDGGPAFPQSEGVEVGQDRAPGMSLRAYIATAVLAAMSARDTWDEGQATPQMRAHQAVLDGDALIAELKR